MARFFNWSMRNGAAVLFGIALLQLLLGLLAVLPVFLSETSRMASDHMYHPAGTDMMLRVQGLFTALSSAMLPFLAAILVNRFDRWLRARADMEARND